MTTLRKIFVFMRSVLAVAAMMLMTMCTAENLIPDVNIPDDEDPIVSESKVYYDDLVIEKFSYDKISPKGDTIYPVLSYSYIEYTLSEGKISNKVLSSDAVVCYYSNDADIQVDTLTGAIIVDENTGDERRVFTVSVAISRESMYGVGKVDVVQNSVMGERLENISRVDTLFIPLTLKPHTCVHKLDKNYTGYPADDLDKDGPRKGKLSKEYTYLSRSENGKMTRASVIDWESKITRGIPNFSSYVGTPEYVSFLGADIPLNPCGLAEVTWYKTGVSDTVFIQYANLTTVGDGTYSDNWENSYHLVPAVEQSGYYFIPEQESFKPSSYVSDNVWHINNCGPHAYEDISHTITASIGNHQSTITLRQNDNFVYDDEYVYGNVNELVSFSDIWTNRDGWPEWEDYPAGSNPKWCKDYAGNNWCTKDTRSLHPDTDRWVSFNVNVEVDRYYTQYKFINGTIQPREKYCRRTVHSPFMQDVVIRCYADVPIAGGKTRRVQHEFLWGGKRSEWIWGTNYMYQDSDYRSNSNGPHIWVPRQKDAVGDFVWTFEMDILDSFPFEKTFRINNTEEALSKIWTTKKWTVRDCTYTLKEYDAVKQFSGFYNAPMYHCCSDATGVHMTTASCIDGKKWYDPEWTKYTMSSISTSWPKWEGCVWENEYEAGDCELDFYPNARNPF